MSEQPDPLTDAFQTLYDLIERYGAERMQQQHEMWWQVENAMQELAEQGIAEGRRQATDLLRKAAEGRRVYAATPHAHGELLDAEARLLDRAADVASGDLNPLYGWLPSWQWTDEMNARLGGPWEPAPSEPPSELQRAADAPTQLGPGEPAEQPEPDPDPPVERLSAETMASILAIVDAPYRPDTPVEYLDDEAEPASGGVVEPSGPLTAEEATPDCVVPATVWAPGHSPAEKLRSLRAHPHGSSCTCDDCTARDEAEDAQREQDLHEQGEGGTR